MIGYDWLPQRKLAMIDRLFVITSGNGPSGDLLAMWLSAMIGNDRLLQ